MSIAYDMKRAIALRDPRYDLFSLILFVTNRCDGACRGCLYAHKLNDKRYQDLTLEEINRVAGEIGKIWHLQISGGEPFLRDDLPEIIQAFSKHSGIKHLTIPTNGLNPGRIEKMTKLILGSYDHTLGIGVSLDGPEQINRKMRGTSAVEPKRSLKLLRMIRRENRRLTVSVITRLSEENSGYHQGWIDGGLGWRKPVIRGTADIAPPISIKMEGKGLRERIVCSFLNASLAGKRWRFPCIAGSKIGVLESDGEVKLCELLPGVGNIRGQQFMDIWKSEGAIRQRKMIDTGSCSKGCTHGCFFGPSMINSPIRSLRYLR